MKNSNEYLQKASKIPPHVVAWLSAEGWTAEELSFIEVYGERYGLDMYYKVSNDIGEVRRLKRIHDRLEAQKGERAREYDSKNNYKGKDSPEWFRASIDRDLFK